MSNSKFTPKDLIATKAKYGNEIVKLDIANTKKNSDKTKPTSYIPQLLRNVAGKYQQPIIKFTRQIICSGAKLPPKTDEGAAKFMQICFRRLTLEDLEGSDYEEDKKEGLLAANTEFIDALDAYVDGCVNCAETEVFPYKGDKFKPKNKGQNKELSVIRQTCRNAGEDEEGDAEGKIPLEKPLYRLRIPAIQESGAAGKLGYNTQKGHVYVIYDGKKSSAARKEDAKAKDVVARVISKDKPTDLTKSNANHFITPYSLVSGTFKPDSVVVSDKYVSFNCAVRYLQVWRHKPTMTDALDAEDRADMENYGAKDESGDDLDVNVDEPEDSDDDTKHKSKGKGKVDAKSKGKPSKNLKKAMENLSDGEMDIPEDEPEDSEDEKVDKKKKVNKVDKKSKKVDKVESESDEDKPKKKTEKKVEKTEKKVDKKPKKVESDVDNVDEEPEDLDVDDSDVKSVASVKSTKVENVENVVKADPTVDEPATVVKSKVTKPKATKKK
jgi:hypothetical protein